MNIKDRADYAFMEVSERLSQRHNIIGLLMLYKALLILGL